MYGSFPPTIQAEQDKWVGNTFGGYYSYTANFAKGIDKTKLANFKEGQWFPDPLGSNIQGFPYGLTEESANKTSYVCIQSVPIRDGQLQEKIFYPITFAEETIKDLKDATYVGAPFPIQVGERWLRGSKTNGIGWFRLESTSIYKAIDLISEGPIEGFCNKNGTSLNFDKEFKLNPNPSPSDPDFLRNEKDDYLQGVFLDDLQVKEVDYSSNQDSYNISEFDIDMGMDSKGTIGGESQGLLDPQYLLTAHTKELNSPLYGPRALSTANINLSAVETKDFVKNKIYTNNARVVHNQNGEDYTYVVRRSLADELLQNNEYKAAGGDIYYLGEEDNAEFYTPLEGFNNFQIFSGEGADYIEGGQSKYYEPGDLIRSRTFGGDTRYYEMGSDADHFLGVFDPSKSYANQVGKILMLDQAPVSEINTTSQIVKITGDYTPGNTLSSFTEALHAEYEDEEGRVHIVVNDPWFVSTYTKTQGVSKNIFGPEVDIIPGSTKSNQLDLWEQIMVNSPIDIKNKDGEDRKNLNIFAKLEKGVKTNEIDPAEENFISHKIINLNVEEVYVSLQIDELSYIYEGDYWEAEYKLGEMMGAIMGGLVGLGGAGSMQSSPIDGMSTTAFAVLAGSLGAIVGLVGSLLTKFTIGTKMENSGEFWPNRAKFRIKYGNEGENLYSTDIYIYGIATSAYRKDIKIYLPKNPLQKDRIIKVYKLNRERNFVKEGEMSARYKERFSLANITEISNVNLSYPNSVVIGTRINARDYSKMPTRNYNLKLKKVAIPSNYNPETRKYSGNWNGLFLGQSNKEDNISESSKKWTDNPAWCLYDLISNKRYGIGKFGIKYNHIDRWTLYKMAKYCDDYVPTGYSPKYGKRNFVISGDKVIRVVSPEVSDSVIFSSEFNYPGKRIAIFYEDGTNESIEIDSIDSSQNKIFLKLTLKKKKVYVHQK